MWPKFGQHHAEERAASIVLSAEFIAKNQGKRALVAANDSGSDVPARSSPKFPMMHPDPFAPESAGGLLAEISRWIASTAIIPVPELPGLVRRRAEEANLFSLGIYPAATGDGSTRSRRRYLRMVPGQADPAANLPDREMLSKSQCRITLNNAMSITP